MPAAGFKKRRLIVPTPFFFFFPQVLLLPGATTPPLLARSRDAGFFPTDPFPAKRTCLIRIKDCSSPYPSFSLWIGNIPCPLFSHPLWDCSGSWATHPSFATGDDANLSSTFLHIGTLVFPFSPPLTPPLYPNRPLLVDSRPIHGSHSRCSLFLLCQGGLFYFHGFQGGEDFVSFLFLPSTINPLAILYDFPLPFRRLHQDKKTKPPPVPCQGRQRVPVPL